MRNPCFPSFFFFNAARLAKRTFPSIFLRNRLSYGVLYRRGVGALFFGVIVPLRWLAPPPDFPSLPFGQRVLPGAFSFLSGVVPTFFFFNARIGSVRRPLVSSPFVYPLSV